MEHLVILQRNLKRLKVSLFTGLDLTQDNHLQMYVTGGLIQKGEASAHFIVKDSEVLQCWPTSKVAWHAGCKQGNDTSIGIEVIPMNVEGEFSKLSIKTLRQLLDTLPLVPIIRHYDWTGKECPKYYCNSRWEQLLKELGRL